MLTYDFVIVFFASFPLILCGTLDIESPDHNVIVLWINILELYDTYLNNGGCIELVERLISEMTTDVQFLRFQWRLEI